MSGPNINVVLGAAEASNSEVQVALTLQLIPTRSNAGSYVEYAVLIKTRLAKRYSVEARQQGIQHKVGMSVI